MDVYLRNGLLHPKAAYAEALRKHGGLVSPTARFLKVSPTTVHQALRRWPSLVDVLQEAKSAALDDTEWALIRAAREGEPWAVQYYLRHQGRERGYDAPRKQEAAPAFKVEVAYTEDALGATRPVTTITQLPPPAALPKGRPKKEEAPPEASAAAPQNQQIEVVEAEVSEVRYPMGEEG